LKTQFSLLQLTFVLVGCRILSDALWAGLPVLVPENEEIVSLGAAIVAACASQEFPSVQVKFFALKVEAEHETHASTVT